MAFAVLLLTLAGAGCSTTPPVRYHSLQPVASASAQVKVAVQPRQRIAIGPVSIPSQLDRPELVVEAGDHRVAVIDRQRWSAPLKDEISRLLAADVGRARKNSVVSVSSQAGKPEADLNVSVHFGRLELEPGVAATLEALWTVQGDDGVVIRSTGSSVRIPVSGPGYDGLVAALSKAVHLLAEQIAATLPR
jgi:hypothetical protein